MTTNDELRAAAEAATPGEWNACNGGNCSCGMVWSIKYDAHIVTVHDEYYDPIPTIKRGKRRSDDEAVIEKVVYGRNGAEAQHANATFIALANPETILALIDRLEAAERVVEAADKSRDCGLATRDLEEKLAAYDALGGRE